jgi:hypothetical protein
MFAAYNRFERRGAPANFAALFLTELDSER